MYTYFLINFATEAYIDKFVTDVVILKDDILQREDVSYVVKRRVVNIGKEHTVVSLALVII